MSITTAEAYKNAQLGKCIAQPLRRGGSGDYLAAQGAELIKAAVEQILHTKKGELPWKPSFGLDVERYRHRNLTDALVAAIAGEVLEALTDYEPRIEIVECDAGKIENRARVKVRWQIVTEAKADNNVIVGPVTQEVTV